MIKANIDRTYYEDNSKFFSKAAFLFACIRLNFSLFFENSIILTLILNLFIVAAIDFKKVRYSFFTFASLSLLVVYNSEVLALIDILALMYILRNFSYKYLIQINAVVLFFFILIWLYSLKLGLLHDEIFIMPKGIAHTLGYKNPNGLGKLGFQIIATLFLLSSGKGKFIVFCLVPIINQVFYYYSASRTPWIGGYVLMFMMLCSYLRIIRPWMRYIIAALPIILTLTIFYLAKHVNQYPEINLLLTGRLSYLSATLSQMSIINWIIGKRIPAEVIMDGSYQMIILSGGVIAFIVFWRSYINKVINKWDEIYKYLPFMIGVLASSLGENIITSCGSISLLFWFISFNNINSKSIKTNYLKS